MPVIHPSDVTAAVAPIRRSLDELEQKLKALAEAPISEHPHFGEELASVDALLTFLGSTSERLTVLRTELAQKFGA